MASTHDESGDDTTSSLGDSTYDFIDDRSNATTDDEDHDALTESTTSSDGPAFEQVHAPSLSSEPRTNTDPRSQGQRPPSSHTQQDISDVDHVSDNQSPEDVVTGLDSRYEHEPIEFDEPSITNLNVSRFTEVSHTLKIIEKQPHVPQLHYDLPTHLPGHLAVTVRQTMTSRSLVLENGQYKILYCGDITARESIVQKIGTALAATLKSSVADSGTPRSSKFNIIPISAFGEESSPDVVLIDSSGLELIVEDCSHATFARKESGNDSLQLELSNGATVRSVWDGSKFALSKDWTLPDLAIFCLPDNDDPASKMTRFIARSFMSRHKVLSIVISHSSTWDKPPTEPITLDYLSPHVCLEPRNPGLVHTQILRRYPVDLATFLNIDAGQMNRNLACLAAASGSTKRGQEQKASIKNLKSSSTSGQWSVRDYMELIVTDIKKNGLRGLNRNEYLAGFGIVLMSLLGALFIGFGLTELLGASRVSTSRVFPTHTSAPSISSISTTSTPTITTTTPAATALSETLPLSSPIVPLASAPSSTSIQTPPTKSLSTNTDLASFLLDTYALTSHKSEQFKVHVLGDCHIVLRPPHWFSKLKKSPKLLFKILRGNSELHHQKTTLFDGVYALQVPREEAYGMLIVEVWTESKPVVNENFEVDFGSSWLKAAGWKKVGRIMTESLRGDLHSVQTQLGSIYDHTKTSLSAFVQQQRKKNLIPNPSSKAMIKSRMNSAAKTKELIVAQTRDLQRTMYKRFRASRAAAAGQISWRAEEFTKAVNLYTRNKTSVVSYQASLVTRAAQGVEVRALINGAGTFARNHLRETQKKALKAWWSVRGAPSRDVMKSWMETSPQIGDEL